MQFKSLIQEARSLIEGPVDRAEKAAAVQQHTPNILAANKKGFKNILSQGGRVTRGPSGITKTMRVLAARKPGTPPPIPKPKRAPGVPPPIPAAALRPKTPAIEDVLFAYHKLMNEGGGSRATKAFRQGAMFRAAKVKDAYLPADSGTQKRVARDMARGKMKSDPLKMKQLNKPMARKVPKPSDDGESQADIVARGSSASQRDW